MIAPLGYITQYNSHDKATSQCWCGAKAIRQMVLMEATVSHSSVEMN